jgi:hypothetical protein
VPTGIVFNEYTEEYGAVVFRHTCKLGFARTTLYHPHCMMHAMPKASLRSLLDLHRQCRFRVPGIDAGGRKAILFSSVHNVRAPSAQHAGRAA